MCAGTADHLTLLVFVVVSFRLTSLHLRCRQFNRHGLFNLFILFYGDSIFTKVHDVGSCFGFLPLQNHEVRLWTRQCQLWASREDSSTSHQIPGHIYAVASKLHGLSPVIVRPLPVFPALSGYLRRAGEHVEQRTSAWRIASWLAPLVKSCLLRIWTKLWILLLLIYEVGWKDW